MSKKQLLTGLQPFHPPSEDTKKVIQMVEWPWSQKKYKEKAGNRSHEAAEAMRRQVSILAWSRRARGEVENSQKQEAQGNGELRAGMADYWVAIWTKSGCASGTETTMKPGCWALLCFLPSLLILLTNLHPWRKIELVSVTCNLSKLNLMYNV